MFEYVVPGDDESGFCLVADRFLVAVSDGLQSSIPLVWPLLTAPDSRAETVFEVLAGRSVSTAPAFAIAEIVDTAAREVHAIVHGEAIAQLPGDPAARISGAGLATWRETRWRDGDGVMIGLGGPRAGVGTLPITGGVVRADWVRWRPAPLAAASGDAGARDGGTDAQPTVAEPTGGADTPPVSPAAGAVPVSPAAGAAPAIRLDDGPPLDLELPLVIGRRPTAGLSQSGAPTVPVVVASPRRLVSARHLLVERRGDAVRLQDLDAKNGSLVRTPGGPAHVLRDGATLTVPIGTRVELGDGVRLEVVAAD